MSTTQRPQRSDAARNRQRLLSAAVEVFAESGLDAGVGEIAARAEIGRATLFRNFPTKQDLIAAVVVEKMQRAVADGRQLLTEEEGRGTAVFAFLNEVVHRQQRERALFEAIADQFLSHPDIRDVQTDLLGLLDDLLDDGKRAGTVRSDVGAVDVMLLIKGVCSAASELGSSPAILDRHLSLVTAAISTPQHAVPLSGRTPTVADMNAAHPASHAS